jgi:hypothetical protein
MAFGGVSRPGRTRNNRLPVYALLVPGPGPRTLNRALDLLSLRFTELHRAFYRHL